MWLLLGGCTAGFPKKKCCECNLFGVFFSNKHWTGLLEPRIDICYSQWIRERNDERKRCSERSDFGWIPHSDVGAGIDLWQNSHVFKMEFQTYQTMQDDCSIQMYFSGKGKYDIIWYVSMSNYCKPGSSQAQHVLRGFAHPHSWKKTDGVCIYKGRFGYHVSSERIQFPSVWNRMIFEGFH